MKTRAFTLVEILVAIGLFAIIATLAVSAYLSIEAANQESQALVTATNSLSFALETMARTIRTGTSYSCGASLGLGDCSAGGSAFTFKDANGITTTYGKSGNAITSTVGSNVSTLTDPRVSVTNLTLYLNGSGLGNPPTVRIVVSGTIPSLRGRTIPFSIETYASMRGINL